MAFPSSPPALPGVVHTDVVVQRHRWHVASAGDGPPVVLLHGWPQHWWMWRDVIGDLARTHRVHAPDLRGFGWSDAPPGDYSKMGLACDVERLLDELGIESCTLVGHDWGALVGWLTTIRAPRRVERLVALSNIHPWPRPRGFDPVAVLSGAYVPVLSTPVLGEYVQRLGAKAIGGLLRGGVARGFRWDPEDVRLFTDQWRRPAHARAASALYRTFLLRELPALLGGRYRNRRVEVPVLLATGRHDPVATPARLAGGEEHAPNMRKVVMEGAGHFVVDEKPEEVVRLIREELGS